MNANDILKQYFGYDEFRAGQVDVIDAILSGCDVLAVMPTGAGKSVCYQVPAMLLSGITLVISPLISLMQDQVQALNDIGIPAEFVNSSLSLDEIDLALSLAENGQTKILYVAPERLLSESFLRFASRADISMVTVDEAHCISQWGQDFRPSYLEILTFIEQLQKRPIVSAFTATATVEVKDDISCTLKLNDPKIVVTGFDRPNLYYRVENMRRQSAKADFVLSYIAEHASDSGIIYCATRKAVDELFMLLFKRGVPVTRYHAGLSADERKQNQDDFIYDRAPVVVATNAFGMGIDKSNVRYVLHYNMPQSMEHYYQEAGRAGRDGEAAECVLLFSAQDMVINKFLIEHKDEGELSPEEIAVNRERDMARLRVMEGYAKTTDCLRNFILRYFGEKTGAPCGSCGNCNGDFTELDMTDEAKQVINCLVETKGRYGTTIVLGILRGAKRARLDEIGATDYRTYGRLRDVPEARLRQLLDTMISDGYIYRTEDQYAVLKIRTYEALKNPETKVIVRVHKDAVANESGVGTNRYGEADGGTYGTRRTERRRATDDLTSAGYELFEKLRALRLSIARDEGLPPYVVFSDKTLIAMCVQYPATRTEMLRVSGVGAVKFEKYGERFLRAIREFLETHPEVAKKTSYAVDEELPNPVKDAPKKKERVRPPSAGVSWDDEEDARLDEEFQAGMKIAEIAAAHGRTNGAIRARLKKHGLIE